MNKIYPDSHVEIHGFLARNYDAVMNGMTAGLYSGFIKSAIAAMNIQPNDRILDLGCGTGRNACLMRRHLNEEGSITGMDISEEMGAQFNEKCKAYSNLSFQNQRADLPFSADQPFDRIFMSFVLHGFPHEARLKTIQNIYGNLKPGGTFCLLDFSEFKMAEMPRFYRAVFKKIECPYAFEFVERNWKEILTAAGFVKFEEHFWFKKYVRLLSAAK